MKKVLVLGLIFIGISMTGYFSDNTGEALYLLRLPLSIIASGLRQLSLGGPVQNVIAVLLYIMIGLIPLLGLIVMKKSKVNLGMMIGLSIAVYVTFYFMINPHIIYEQFQLYYLFEGDTIEKMIQLALAYSLYAFILLFVVIKGLNQSLHNLERLLKGLVYIIIGVLTIYYAYGVTADLVVKVVEEETMIVSFYHGLKLVSALLIYGCFVGVLYYGKDLIVVLLKQRFEKNAVHISHIIIKVSKLLITIVLISQIILNGYQLIFIKHFSDIHFSFDLPLIEFTITLVFLIMSDYFNRVHSMQEDHELVI